MDGVERLDVDDTDVKLDSIDIRWLKDVGRDGEAKA